MSNLHYTQNSKHSNRRKHEFLLTFFSKPDRSEQKEVNGYILNEYFNNNTHQWEVLIFTPLSWEKARQFVPQIGTPIEEKKKLTKFQKLYAELSGKPPVTLDRHTGGKRKASLKKLDGGTNSQIRFTIV